MTDGWRDRLAARRVRPGAGEPLPRFRWWQLFGRSLRTLTLRAPDGSSATYAVDVRRAGDGSDGAVRARLYLDGALLAHSTLPARFPVAGGHIEVAVGTFGLRRCHHVRADGGETQLAPDPSSAEGRRAQLHRTRPRLSGLIGLVSAGLVIAGLCVTVPQLLQAVSQAPPIADSIGTFTSPVRLPPAASVLIAIAAVIGSTERALRMRSSWLDDLAS
ncbi:hypothetical protein GB931_12985 [Modestobacter sp. I12A-02628]|uniref:Uncharacterized protein n=1 Tax=Goekera deserti TaxID=2497753 RepID=A0A7K3WC62_9ACTN|nr:hypothetical protein [Goekera deserti]MPQ98817.1 hypothetical protein [Goekera deserti]NDI49684.1 hypothetical protein [Goekera deserti]NEL53123.1 hypothetical protein [Goekera deserti]